MSTKTPTWLITGASSGFGLSLTRLALSNSHTVIATSRSPSTQPHLQSLISSHSSTGSLLLPFDLTSPTSASSLIQQLEDERGIEIDVLVNCGGEAMLGAAESFTDEEVKKQMDVLFFGPVRLMTALTPKMRARGRGIIVMFSSGAGVDGREGMSVYGAGKAALDNYTRIAAKELQPFNIRTLIVQLGAFNTNFSNTVSTHASALPAAYKDSMVEKVIESITGGDFKPDGDHEKATKVVFDVIVGQGVGEGKGWERSLPLGRDMYASLERFAEVQKKTVEAFGEAGKNVYLDKSS